MIALAVPGAFAAGLLSLTSCTSLPRPGDAGGGPASVSAGPDASALVAASARQAGDPWRNASRVVAAFSGRWSGAVEALQPVLVDSGFRKSSVETYDTRSGAVIQVHSGPAGTKLVERTADGVTVRRNGRAERKRGDLAAAALVADAYRLFVFRASWLAARGGDFQLLGRRRLAGEECWLVQAMVEPGFGFSERDWVIAWIGAETMRTHRVQLTLFGLESTAGADVDVTFSDWIDGPRGGEWPASYVERVRRPFDIMAHAWRLQSLRVN